MYKFDKQNLEFIKVHWSRDWIKLAGGYLIIVLFVFGGVPYLRHLEMEHEVKLIMANESKFTEEKLIDEIKGLHFPFPYIVMAQAIHESGNYSSKLFLENRNMFGMKAVHSRITTCKGEQEGYALYDTWTDCVVDRALYSTTYLSTVKTEDEYYNFLSQFYAEDKEYVDKLKRIINQRELKKVFNINN